MTRQLFAPCSAYPIRRIAPFLGLGATVLWTYWPSLCEAANRWAHDPRYSHGYLVPGFAAFLLWLRRGQLAGKPLLPNCWGIPLLAAGTAIGLAGAYFYVEWFALMALLPSLAGLFLLLGGWRALRWSWPAIGFLIFMVPLPYHLEEALAHPLQRLATSVSTYSLQTFGFAARAEGNVIILNDVRIGVEEACSGLSMVLTSFALATAIAFLIQRPAWHRLVLLLSALPIAFIANVVRITLTGLLYETAGSALANAVFHDLSGWLMMPLALGMLWVVLQILARLFIEPAPIRPLPIQFAGVGTTRHSSPARDGSKASTPAV